MRLIESPRMIDIPAVRNTRAEHTTAHRWGRNRSPGGSAVAHYLRGCRHELLLLTPSCDTLADLAVQRSRPPRMRSLCPLASVREAGRMQLSGLARAGVAIRISASELGSGPAAVVDQKILILMSDSANTVVTRERSAITWVVTAFEHLWLRATPATDMLTDPTCGGPRAAGNTDDLRAAILAMMANGDKDETIARRLSISVRTCRRQIADYMAEVGATSRFQAGVAAVRDGYLDTRNLASF